MPSTSSAIFCKCRETAFVCSSVASGRRLDDRVDHALVFVGHEARRQDVIDSDGAQRERQKQTESDQPAVHDQAQKAHVFVRSCV